MAETEEDCLAILEAESAFGRRLVQLGFMRRFDARYRAMKDTLLSGVIGAPLIFQQSSKSIGTGLLYGE